MTIIARFVPVWQAAWQVAWTVMLLPLWSFLVAVDAVLRLVKPRRVPLPKSALITGGGSGIGRALSLEYARRGVSLLVLGDRNADALQTVAAECRAASAAAGGSLKGACTTSGSRHARKTAWRCSAG
jgi:hypothetical protein